MNCSVYILYEVDTSRMDIVSFVQQEKDRNAKISRIVKDFSVFDFSYIPNEPIMRQELLLPSLSPDSHTGLPKFAEPEAIALGAAVRGHHLRWPGQNRRFPGDAGGTFRL